MNGAAAGQIARPGATSRVDLRFAAALGLLFWLLALSGCASAPTAVEGLAATARLHATTMEAAGYAAEAGALAPEQLAEVRDAGRRVELLLRAAQAALEIHLITSGGATGEGLDARLAELQAAVMELVRVAVAAGLEVGR